STTNARPKPARTPTEPVDALSDKATTAFVRRVLCAHHVPSDDKGRRPALDELLPPLTSSNDVDLQLYAIIAVIIKDFVYAWYAKITPDHAFVDSVLQIIAHCTRALEQRVRNVDLEALLLDELPALLEQHFDAHRLAHRCSHADALAPDPRHIYHTLHPHPALDPVPASPDQLLAQQEHEAAWRQLLVQGVLAVLLPTEDLDNACLRALVGEIVAEMIIGGAVGSKMAEPWFLWEAVEKVAEALQQRKEKGEEELDKEKATSRLEQFGLLSARSEKQQPEAWRSWVFWSAGFWSVCQILFVAFSILRSVVLAGLAAPGLGGRGEWASQPVPVVSMRAWTLAGVVLEMDGRMPWTAGMLGLAQWAVMRGPGRVGDTNGPLDKLLSHHLRARLLDPAHLPPALRALRASLFPNNAPGAPRPPPPTKTEAAATRARAAKALLAALPPVVRRLVFGRGRLGGWDVGTAASNGGGADAEAMQADVEALLDVFGDAYLNKHLVFGIVELVVARLMPEL
ncbi:uncharacterized protein K452DRAFT_204712, partial [Aplosporella prunicola CBS 121167]